MTMHSYDESPKEPLKANGEFFESMDEEEIKPRKYEYPVPNVLIIQNPYIRDTLSEFFGTFILVLIGDGVVAQTVLSSNEGMPRGNISTIHIGWGLAVTMALFACSTVSGGHINPAFSLTCCVIGKLPWIKLPFYVLGQYLGAFMGASVVYVAYYERLVSYEALCQANLTSHIVSGPCATAGIFATYPQPYLSAFGGFMDQVIGTALLSGLALAVINKKGFNTPGWTHPFFVGLIVVTLVAAFEYNCGAALNPARDLGPRIFTAVAGWGWDVFSFRNYNWFWVPILGPHCGALIGAGIYLVLIDIHMPIPPEVNL